MSAFLHNNDSLVDNKNHYIPRQLKHFNYPSHVTITTDTLKAQTVIEVMTPDRPGVLARVATILAEQGISIEALIQKEATEGELVPIILLTHRTKEKQMNEAIREIEAMADIAGPVTRIRVESLDEGE